VTVNNISTNITFNPNYININVGQNISVNINSGNNNNLYISSVSNPNIVTANLSGSTLNLRGQNTGTSLVTVCNSNSNSQCGTLTVNVGNNNQGSLYFTTTSLPQARVNQYYSYQLGISGGSAPYNFSVYSGSLPQGLFLTNGGLIWGIPTSTSTANFSIRATDNFGGSIISSTFYMTPTTGSVAGSFTYNNGTLVNDNGTIYITYKNTKSGFANYTAFAGMGFKLENTINASTNGINLSGFTVTNPNAAHPWGSWIKNGSTIYFVHESGLIPIPTYDTFTNNGGVIKSVVEANSFDFNKTIQSAMIFNDNRLK
jgi:hypothetical protein